MRQSSRQAPRAQKYGLVQSRAQTQAARMRIPTRVTIPHNIAIPAHTKFLKLEA